MPNSSSHSRPVSCTTKFRANLSPDSTTMCLTPCLRQYSTHSAKPLRTTSASVPLTAGSRNSPATVQPFLCVHAAHFSLCRGSLSFSSPTFAADDVRRYSTHRGFDRFTVITPRGQGVHPSQRNQHDQHSQSLRASKPAEEHSPARTSKRNGFKQPRCTPQPWLEPLLLLLLDAIRKRVHTHDGVLPCMACARRSNTHTNAHADTHALMPVNITACPTGLGMARTHTHTRMVASESCLAALL